MSCTILTQRQIRVLLKPMLGTLGPGIAPSLEVLATEQHKRTVAMVVRFLGKRAAANKFKDWGGESERSALLAAAAALEAEA